MLFTEALQNWKHQPHGARKQAMAISYISMKMVLYETFSDELEDTPTLNVILEDCHRNQTPDVHVTTLRRWWGDYLNWGELPYQVKRRKQLLKKNSNMMSKSAKINDAELLILKKIVDDHPNQYLDELALLFAVRTGKFLHYSTVWKYVHGKLNYSLQALTTRAKQQCEDDQERFLQALAVLLQECPERLITIDETHKDRNASRRRRGWALKNSGGVNAAEWFRNVVRYTLIAAADINGFIPSACHTVLREELSDEGAAGTVDSEYFLYWVKEYLCPVLGNFEFGEPRSVVFMDNASTHMSQDVEDAIRATGAVLIYGAPFSPHLNPIENYFSMYKAYLKRNEARMLHYWHDVHMEALLQVDRDNGIKYFRRCGIPGSELMLTTDEFDELYIN